MRERNGLREQAQRLLTSIHSTSLSRILILYMLMRQLTTALGLTALGGHAQMVRPLIAPMAEGAVRKNGWGIYPRRSVKKSARTVRR